MRKKMAVILACAIVFLILVPSVLTDINFGRIEDRSFTTFEAAPLPPFMPEGFSDYVELNQSGKYLRVECLLFNYYCDRNLLIEWIYYNVEAPSVGLVLTYWDNETVYSEIHNSTTLLVVLPMNVSDFYIKEVLLEELKTFSEVTGIKINLEAPIPEFCVPKDYTRG